MEWAYDTWTSPWTQISGDPLLISPGSHATLVVLTCAAADLERERAARHLSAEECEHRMAAIRAEQDSALVFRLHFRVFNFPTGEALARLSPEAEIVLEDDRGRRWHPVEATRGAVLPTVTGQKLRRYAYDPPWLRADRVGTTDGYVVLNGKELLVGEHRVRFARRDPGTGSLVVGGNTRWLALRVRYGGNEWVSTWKFRLSPEANARTSPHDRAGSKPVKTGGEP